VGSDLREVGLLTYSFAQCSDAFFFKNTQNNEPTNEAFPQPIQLKRPNSLVYFSNFYGPLRRESREILRISFKIHIFIFTLFFLILRQRSLLPIYLVRHRPSQNFEISDVFLKTGEKPTTNTYNRLRKQNASIFQRIERTTAKPTWTSPAGESKNQPLDGQHTNRKSHYRWTKTSKIIRHGKDSNASH
jgi:hypothetical protein